MIARNKEYSNDLRELVIEHFLNDSFKYEMDKKVLIDGDSINYIIAKYELTKRIGNLIDRG